LERERERGKRERERRREAEYSVFSNLLPYLVVFITVLVVKF
jgi:hypothetical protein